MKPPARRQQPQPPIPSTHIGTVPGGNGAALGPLTPKTVPLWAHPRWTLDEEDVRLLASKSGATRLGFALT